jgi:hypothetical protein
MPFLDKAAQAAAQAAQAAALQAHYTTSTIPSTNAMTPEQALMLLHKLSQQGYISPAPPATSFNDIPNGNGDKFATNVASGLGSDSSQLRSGHDIPQNIDAFTTTNGLMHRPDIQRTLSNFSPFSPDPNAFTEDFKSRETPSFARTEALPHPSKAYAPGFYPHQLQPSQDLKQLYNASVLGTSGVAGKTSPAHPSSASRYGPYLDMADKTITRPDSSSRSSSGQYNHPTSTTWRTEGDRGDDLEDINLTLANLKFLDEDRSYASPMVNSFSTGAGVSMVSYQQHSHGHGHAFKPSSSPPQ